MKLVVSGSAIGSSRGNGHATLWPGMCRALARRGVRVVFFEHDVCWHAQRRDRARPDGAMPVLHEDWPSVRARARRKRADADAAIATSHCPDALPAHAEILEAARPLAAFHDLDSPVTIAAAAGEPLPHIGARGLRDYDPVLSCADGPALQSSLHARNEHSLHGQVDSALQRPGAPSAPYRSDLCRFATPDPPAAGALR